jgi:cysteinyl-tRNA synthetase
MSTKYLGQPFDIHGGGLENIFPHHECEIAQSEAANEKAFARYWIHNNMITINGTKMGKSLGNSVTVKDMIKKYDALSIRFFVLSSHYRSSLDFSDDALLAAQKGLQKINQTLLRLLKTKAGETNSNQDITAKISAFRERFIAEMNDDFNTPRAIAAVFDLIRDFNSWLDETKNPAESELDIAINAIEETVGEVLGLLPKDARELSDQSESNINGIMDLLISIRKKLREQKAFELADEIRKGLTELNITLKDTPEGTTWEQN